MRLRKCLFTAALAGLMIFNCFTALATTLVLPERTEIIEEGAFYGDTSIGEVVLGERVREIRSQAFAKSALTKINLPTSVTYISDDALPGPGSIDVLVHEGTYAYKWACRNGYIPHEHIWDNGEITELPHDNNGGTCAYRCVICDAIYVDAIPSSMPISLVLCDRLGNPLDDEMIVKDELILYFTMTAAGGDDAESDAGSIHWDSSNDSVAYVETYDDSSGSVRFLGDGIATITATAENGKVCDSVKITAVHDETYEATLSKALSLIDDSMSERQKTWTLYSWLIDNCSYDYTLYYEKPGASGMGYRAYGAIALGKAVCSGYTDAMRVLLDKVGIWVGGADGLLRGEAHAWNTVRIDGEYYFLDATIGDSMRSKNGYFLKKTMHGYDISDFVSDVDGA